VLAVDNLSGAKVAGRKIRVEHVGNYRKHKQEARSLARSRAVQRRQRPEGCRRRRRVCRICRCCNC
jgi:hypothetical protein